MKDWTQEAFEREWKLAPFYSVQRRDEALQWFRAGVAFAMGPTTDFRCEVISDADGKVLATLAGQEILESWLLERPELQVARRLDVNNSNTRIYVREWKPACPTRA